MPMWCPTLMTDTGRRDRRRRGGASCLGIAVAMAAGGGMGLVSDKGGKSTATARTSVGWWPAPEWPWLCVIVVVDLTVVTRDLSSLSVFLRVVGGGGSDGDVAPTSTGDTEADGYGRACASCLGVVAAAEAAGVGVSEGEGEYGRTYLGGACPRRRWCRGLVVRAVLATAVWW